MEDEFEALVNYIAQKAQRGIWALIGNCGEGKPCNQSCPAYNRCKQRQWAEEFVLASCQYLAQKYSVQKLQQILKWTFWVQNGCDLNIGIARQIEELQKVFPQWMLEPFIFYRSCGIGISATTTSKRLYPAIRAIIRHTIKYHSQYKRLHEKVVLCKTHYALPQDIVQTITKHILEF